MPFVSSEEMGRLRSELSGPEVPKFVPGLEHSPDLIERYRLFVESTGAKTDVIYHPCSGYNVSPSDAFPNSSVIYCEIDQSIVDLLASSGYEARLMSANEFVPDVPVDVLILLNPSISPNVPASSVEVGGYVVCNNYHGTASALRDFRDFRLVGVIRRCRDGYFYDSDNLNDFFTEVETDAEWKETPYDPFNFDAMPYREARELVFKVFGDYDDMMGRYREIVQMASERLNIGIDMFPYDLDISVLCHGKGESPAGIVVDQSDPNVPPMYAPETFILRVKFPMKKGGVDDLYVFMKIS